MTDNPKPTEVLIEREGRTFRWGQGEYFRTWNGLKETWSASALKALALPLAFVFGIVAFISGKKEEQDRRGREVAVPTLTQDVPIIEARILDDRSMPSHNQTSRAGQSVTGRIRVFRLGQLSEIPVGSEAKAVLESGASNGIVKGRLVSALKVDGEEILPERTTIFGRGRSTEERLYVEFHKAVLPGGETITLRGSAFDFSDKILGLKGALIGTRSRKMGLAIGFGVLGGLADGLQSSTSGSNIWGVQEKKSMRDAALAGASKAALDQSAAYIDEMKNSPNIIEVKAGTEFYLITDEPKSRKANDGSHDEAP